MNNLARIVGRGVDWVTATATGEHEQHALWNIGEQLLGEVREPLGVNLERVELRGYRGWLGAGIFLGKRDDSVMLRGSSDAAKAVFGGLYATGERFTITRLDIQVTGQFDHDRECTARETESAAIAAVEKEKKVGRRKVESHRGNGRGDTCTIGSRTSQRYLRCYDKTREQRGQIDDHMWRWEVEYKAPLSTGIANHLGAVEVRESAIIDIVAQEFRRKGVNVPWASGPAVELPTTGVSTTDDGKRLVWLNTQVQPVITKLVSSVGLRAVLIALGLEDLFPED